MTKRVPAEIFPPGEFIRDELEARGWSQADLASILGRPVQFVNEILAGKKALTPETAQGLAAAFGTDPEFWLNLEAVYRLSLARQDNEEVARRARLYGLAPIKDMIRRQWIHETADVEYLEREVMEFFELSSLEEQPKLAVSARKGTSYAETTSAQMAWFYRAKHLATAVDAVPYKKERIDELLATLRQLTSSEEEVRRVPRILADFGIRLVFVEHLPRTRIDGAAFWLDAQRPVIAMSLRFDRIDWFWFTLGHEIAHVKNEDSLSLDNDLVGEAPQRTDEKSESERKADEISADLLVPKKEIESFIVRARRLYYTKKIIQFSNRIGVHPGIVIGQLQRRGEIGYSQGRDWLVKVRQLAIGSALTDGWGNAPSVA